MVSKIKYILFIFISLVYLEALFNYIIFGTLINKNIILFAMPISLLIYLITNFFNLKVKMILTYIILGGIIFVYIGQLIYISIFGSIFSLASLKNSNAVIEYLGFVVEKVISHSIAIFYLSLPLIFLIIFKDNIFNHEKVNWKTFVISIVLIVGIHFANVQILPNSSMYSAYNLYYKINAPMLMVNKLGLLTTMRLDVQRLLIGVKNTDYVPNENKNNKEEEKTITYNELEIDWDTLIANETDETIKTMHEYFKNVTPTKHNDHTGLFKGKNLIWILAESFDGIAIDKDITPNLYRMVTEGYNFTNFYTPIFRSTTDGEYITKTGLVPKEGLNSMYYTPNNYLPFALGNMFKEQNYQTIAYHNGWATYYKRNTTHPNFGYEKYIACGQGLNIDCSLWPQSDLEMIEATAHDFIGKDKPFMVYYLTISGHLRYNKWNAMAKKNWNKVKDLDYSTTIKCYLAQHVELDNAIGKLITYLEGANIAEDTVIAISTDHWPYGLTLDYINERANPPRTNNFERERLPFIIWHKGITPTTVTKLGSSMDILPTLANLFGLPYDSRLLMGRDLFSDAESIVIFADRSWITDKGIYNAVNGKFSDPNVDEKYIDEINQIVYNRFNMSRLILEKNYYAKVINKQLD
jgi:lipoteichoic acid synthase